jgi:cytidine deaminase
MNDNKKSDTCLIEGAQENDSSLIPPEILRPDLYIGLVGAAGTDLTSVRDELRAQMAVVGYSVEHIKVSDLLREVLDATPSKDESTRIKKLMAAGDAIRASSEDGDGVAALIITEIRRRRGADITFKGSTAYIIDSLKNPKEVELFDNVYGRNYYTLSVYLSREERIKNLSNKIAKDRHQPLGPQHRSLAVELIIDDEKGSGDHAQNVRDTFPKADYFINSRRVLGEQVKRFVDLVFGEPFTTPTIDEFHMFLARAAGYRSADLSRQVGAVIVDSRGSVASTGCNEVPYPGGGFFYEGREGGPGDNRDYVNQFDPNYAEIQRTLIELITVLRSANYLEDVEDDGAIVEALLQGQHKELMSNARIKSLIEFGRIVHAEMHAICEAAAAGKAIGGGTLYCTTFPCHVCARHVIAAGLKEVVYIEPYPKSLAAQLYPTEIEFAHEAGPSTGLQPLPRVVFRPFHGTAPVFFQRAFRYRTRKDRYGTIATWVPTAAEPQGAALSVERPLLEAKVANSVATVLEKAKVAYDRAMEEV